MNINKLFNFYEFLRKVNNFVSLKLSEIGGYLSDANTVLIFCSAASTQIFPILKDYQIDEWCVLFFWHKIALIIFKISIKLLYTCDIRYVHDSYLVYLVLIIRYNHML